ncbi:signal recognition particle-docking protein FtsY [Aquifex pyrophilus]
MVFFWRKSDVEKKAEKGDKNAILELIKQGKREKAEKILKKYADENEEFAELLFELYVSEGKFVQAYPYLKKFGDRLGTAKERAKVYQALGKYEDAVREFLKVGDFESLYNVAKIYYQLEKPKEAYKYAKRAEKIVPYEKKQELEEFIRKLEIELGLVKEEKESVLEKLKKGLKKTKEAVEFSLLFRGRSVDEEFFEELEELLVKADVGVKTAVEITERLRKEAIRKNIKSSEEIKELLKRELLSILKNCEGKLKIRDKKASVILFVGVNGSGKTTTIGKLAHKLKSEGKKVLLVAGDTFRAAAVEQLEVWAKRAGVDIVKKEEGADPGAVVYEGVKKAKEEGYDVVLIDTAGRLHTKEPLIKELRKIVKVIKKFDEEEPTETLLVMDATTGQNAIQQAKVFKEAVDITGIVVTKLDGSAKGGFIVAVCKEFKIPIKLVGVGEGIDDLQPFDAEAYVNALLD